MRGANTRKEEEAEKDFSFGDFNRKVKKNSLLKKWEAGPWLAKSVWIQYCFLHSEFHFSEFHSFTVPNRISLKLTIFNNTTDNLW